MFSNLIVRGALAEPRYCCGAHSAQKFFGRAGNKRGRGTVVNIAASVAFETVSKEDQPMTIRTRITLGVSIAALSLSLALAPAAFAQDKMGKDDAKKDTMSKDTMKKDTMSKDAMKKDDG